MGRKSNWPSAQEVALEPGEISRSVQKMEELRELDRPQTDAEFENRVRWYFEWCVKSDFRPSIESLALALSRTRQGLWKIQQGGGRKAEIITAAKQTICALLEQWALTGRLNPATYCFSMKNHFGYTDDMTLELRQTEPELESVRRRSIEEIQTEYLRDGAAPLELPEVDFSEE